MTEDEIPQLRPRGMRAPGPEPEVTPQPSRKPRWLLPSAGGAGAFVVVVVLVIVLGGGGADDTEPVAAADAPAPTAQTAPAADPDGGLPGAGQPLEVSEDGKSVLVPAGSGELVRIELAALTVGGGKKAVPSAQLFAGAGQAYLVDQAAGTVQRVDPADFSPVGPERELGSDLGRPQVDPLGTLWVPVPGNGTVVPVQGAELGEPVAVARKGNPLLLTLSSGLPVVTDPKGGRATVINPSGPPRQIKLPKALKRANPKRLLVPSTTDGTVVPVLAPDQKSLTLINVQDASVDLIPFDAEGDEVYEPQVLASRVYIPDQTTGELKVYAIEEGRFLPDITVSTPNGSLQAFVRNGNLWVNDQKNNVSAVVDANGKIKPIGTVKQTVTIKFLNALRKVLQDIDKGAFDDKRDKANSGNRDPAKDRKLGKKTDQ